MIVIEHITQQRHKRLAVFCFFFLKSMFLVMERTIKDVVDSSWLEQETPAFKEEDSRIDRKWNLKFPLPSCFSRWQRMRVSDAQAGSWGQASLKGNTILSFFTLRFFLSCLILPVIVNSGLWTRQTVKNSFLFILQLCTLKAPPTPPSPRGSPLLIYNTSLISHQFQVFLYSFLHFSHSITQQSISN